MEEGLEEFTGVGVGKMSVAASDALFQVRGVGTVEKHGNVMVCFHYETMAVLELGTDELCGHTQVSTDAKPSAVVLDDKPHGLAGVVGNGERLYPKVTHAEWRTRLKHAHIGHFPCFGRQSLQCATGGVHREVTPPAQDSQTTHVVLVLMSDHQCMELLQIHRGFSQPGRHLLATQTRIHEDTGLLAAHEDGIPLGPAGKDLEEK